MLYFYNEKLFRKSRFKFDKVFCYVIIELLLRKKDIGN